MFGVGPMPASLENMPRLTPLSGAAISPPVTPPAASLKPNALCTMVTSIPGTASMFSATTTRASSRYAPAMNGTT